MFKNLILTFPLAFNGCQAWSDIKESPHTSLWGGVALLLLSGF